MAGLNQEAKNSKLKLWFKRLGWAGVIFFTLKGLVWLAVFFGLGKIIGDYFGI